MKKTILCLAAIIGVFFIVGCAEQVVCNKPYIRFGIECCLDNNGNSICDNDEPNAAAKKESETTSDTKGGEIPIGRGVHIDEGIYTMPAVNCSKFRLSIESISFETGILKFDVVNGGSGKGDALVKVSQANTDTYVKRVYIPSYDGENFEAFFPQTDPTGINMGNPLTISVAVTNEIGDPACDWVEEVWPQTIK